MSDLTSNNWINANVERIRKEAALACSRYLSQNFSAGTEEKHKNQSARTASIPTDSPTGY